MPRPKLLILHPALDDAHDGDLPVARLAGGLAEKADVTLLLMAGGAGGRAAAALSHKVKLVTAVGATRGSRRALIGALPPLVQRLKASPPDTLLATGRDAGWLAAAARIAAGRPGRLIVKVDRPTIGGRGGGIARRIQATVFGEAARVLVPSDADRRAMAAAFPGQAARFLTVSEPYVADAKAPPPPRRTGDLRRLVATGGTGIDLLLKALAATPGHVRLTVVGGDAKRIAEASAEAGVADRVEALPPGPLTRALRDADLFVMPKADTALPPALIEALAADRAVVSTDDFASARDLLEGAPGCAVVRAGDAAAMGRAILAALQHGPRPSLRPIAERHVVAASVQAHGWTMGVM